MTWRCRKCRNDRTGTAPWACTRGGYCMPSHEPQAPPADPWDAFRPLALPPLIAGWDPATTKLDRTALSTCDGFGKALKFRDIPTAPIARRYLDGLMELADAFAAEEAPFNLDRGGR